MSKFKNARKLTGCAGVIAALLLAGSTLGAQQKDAFLKAKVDPGRAGVFVDGKYVGPAANFRMTRKYALPAGQHQIKLADPRFEEVTTTVDLKAGQTTVISQTLKALPVPKGPFGTIRTENADKFAAVYLNDKYYGHADEFSNFAQGILVPPGEYTIRVEPAAGAPVSQKVKVEAGKTVLVK